MACFQVALDKRPGVRPVGIRETLRRDLAKIVMAAAGDQSKTACGNLQLCAGLEASIEGAKHAVGQRQLKRALGRRCKEEEANDSAVEEDESGGVAAEMGNLSIETAGTEEEAAAGLAAALGMEIEEERVSEGKEGGDGTRWALEALEFLTQDAEPSITTLVDAPNGFNKLSLLAMLWAVQHRWPAGERFAFNCYLHWAQLLLHNPGEPPVTILSREGVT